MGIGPDERAGDVVPLQQAVVGATLSAFRPTHVSHKQVEAHSISATKFWPDGSGQITLKGGAMIDVPIGFASRGTPNLGDMLVRYAPTPEEPNGYLSHSPLSVFNAGYSSLAARRSSLSFGAAIEALKVGERVCRSGWNGKGMWLALSGPLQGREIAFENFWSEPCSEFARLNGGSATVLPCINMKTAAGEILMGWLASQTDMLAEDWMVLPDDAA